MQSRISVTLSASDRQAVLDAIQTIQEKLPFLVDLSPEERRALPKMGDKSVAFVRRSVEMAQEGSDYLPGAFDTAEFRADLESYDTLLPLLQKVTRLHELIDDTMVLIGSDLYVAALEHYAAAKRAGRTEGLDGLMDVLGRRFASRQSRKAPAA